MGRFVVSGVIVLALSLGATLLHLTFEIPEELKKYGAPFPPGILEKIEAAQMSANMKNAALVGGLVGLCFCAGLPLGAGLTTKSSGFRTAVTGAVLGTLFGAVGGAISPVVSQYLMAHPTVDPFLDGLLVQGCLSLAIAVAMAITVGLTDSGKQHRQVAVVLVICGLIATVLYPFAAAAAFPLLKSNQPIPEGLANRALWLSIPIILYFRTLRGRSAVPQPSDSPSA